MYISFGSEREPHQLFCYVDEQRIENYKYTKSRKNSLRNSERYYIEKKGEIIITILETLNNKLFRLLVNSIVVILALIGGNSDFEDYFSLKYNRGKLVLRIVSNNLEDEIVIHQIMKNPPFSVETIQSYDNFSCEIIYNGRFEGKYSKEENRITGKDKKNRRRS